MHTHFWLNVRPSVLFFINLKKQKKNLITFEYRIAQTEQIKRAPQRSWHIFKTYDNHLSPWPQDRANYNTVGKKPTRTRQKVNNQTKNTIYTVAERYNKHVELLQGNCWSKIQIQKRLEKGILLLSEGGKAILGQILLVTLFPVEMLFIFGRYVGVFFA